VDLITVQEDEFGQKRQIALVCVSKNQNMIEKLKLWWSGVRYFLRRG